MQTPKFTLDDVKYADSAATYRRARDLYRTGKVKELSATPRGYRAVVQGTHPYQVILSQRSIDQCDCACYLGEHGRLCKHVLALALAVLHACGKTTEPQAQQPPASLAEAKPIVTAAMRKLRRYTEPPSP